MTAIQSIYSFVVSALITMAVVAIVLIILRSVFNYVDINPFSWSARTIRRLTDPVVMPVRRKLLPMRIDPRAAPFVAAILIIIVAFFAAQVVGSILNMAAGIMYARSSGKPGVPVAIAGYLIFGGLGLYTLIIFIRLMLSWGTMRYANPWMRFLIRITEPLLGPLRRHIKPVGMFDISPIVAFLIVWLCQMAVAGTLLRGWTVRFF
jgi:YggT family protein